MSANSNAPKAPAVFKFAGRIYFFIALVVVMGAFGFLLFVVQENRHGSISLGDVVGYGLFLFFLFVGIGAVMGQSDIVIDDIGISKRLLGCWTWKTIRWDNIQIIKTSPFFNPSLRKMVRVITIYPSVRPRFRLSPAGGIRFMDVAENMNELIEIMNYYITQHSIKIETTDSGVKTSAIHL